MRYLHFADTKPVTDTEEWKSKFGYYSSLEVVADWDDDEVLRSELGNDEDIPSFEELGEELGGLVTEKQAAYGNSFETAGEALKLLVSQLKRWETL